MPLLEETSLENAKWTICCDGIIGKCGFQLRLQLRHQDTHMIRKTKIVRLLLDVEAMIKICQITLQSEMKYNFRVGPTAKHKRDDYPSRIVLP
jgi:hypothetical protein